MLLVFLRHFNDLLHILFDPEFFQRFNDVFTRDCLLCLAFRDVVGFARDQSDELNAAVD
jgi:hypothetical protein